MVAARSWAFVPRPAEVARIQSALDSGSGAAIVGHAGAGKSALMAEFISEFADSLYVLPIAATAALRSIPFGPFTGLLDHRPVSDRSEVLHRLRSRLEHEAAGRSILVSVDDVHLLDPGSLAFVESVIAAGVARALVTVRSDDEGYRHALPSLKDGLLVPVWVGDLDLAQTREMIAAMLGAEPTHDLLQMVWLRSGGNPLFVRELLFGALDTNSIVVGGGVATLPGSLTPSRLLRELIRDRLTNIEPEGLTALGFLSLAEPLERRVITDTIEPHTLESLEARRFISGGAEALRCSHPLIGEMARTMAVPSDLTRYVDRYRRVVGPRPDPSRALRLATALDETGQHVPGEMGLISATEAMRRLDPSLAVQILRRVPVDESTYELRLLEATALGLSDRLDESVEMLDELIASESDPSRKASAAVRRAQVDYFTRGQAEDALGLLEAVSAEIGDPTALAELQASRTVALAVLGQFEEILTIAPALLEGGDLNESGLVSTTLSLSLAQTLTGRVAGVDQVIEAGIAAAGMDPGKTPFGAEQLRFNRVLARQAEGDLRGAHAEVDAALSEARDGRIATEWLYLASHTASLDGGHREAAVRLTNAVDRLLESDSFASAPLAICLLVLHQIRAGALDAAQETFRMLDAVQPTTQKRHLAWIRRTRLWLEICSGGGDPTGFVKIGTDTVSDELHVWAALAFHDATRCGAYQLAAGPLGELAGESRGGLIDLLASVATAAAEGDTDALADASSRARRSGAGSLAADAQAIIATIEPDTIRGRRAAFVATQAGSQLANHWSPVWAGVASPLTPRQTEVAQLAARGLSTNAIANALYLSPRTVDNHLHRVFRTLDLEDRAGLAGLIDPES